MRSGVVVLGVFALLWAGAALISAGCPLWLIAGPLTISAALCLWAFRTPVPPRTPEEGRRIGRAVGLWSAVEGIAILAAINLLPRFGAAAAIPSAIAIIVGLHFLPLARALSRPLYYATGAAQVALGAASLLVLPPLRLPLLGAGAALVLWASAAALIAGRDRHGSARPR